MLSKIFNSFKNKHFSFKQVAKNLVVNFMLTFLIVLFNQQNIYCQWSSVKPVAKGYNFNSMAAISPGYIYIASDSASVFISNDFGCSWIRMANVASFSNSVGLLSIFFLDSINGWVAGTNGSIAYTNDGGKNWTGRKLSDSTTTINQIRFTDSFHGWIVGNGKVQFTTNAGESWKLTHDFGKDYTIKSIWTFPNDNHNLYIAGDNGFIAKSTDGGIVWSKQRTGNNQNLLCIKFSSKELGWAIGNSGTILMTNDEGLSWKTVKSPVKSDLTYSLVTDDGKAIIGNDRGEIFLTVDYGKTWSKSSLTMTGKINSLANISGFLLALSNDGKFGIIDVRESPELMKLCLDSYKICLDKCNQDEVKCIKECNWMFLECIKVTY